MTPAELKLLKDWLTGEVDKRRKLGGYSQESGPILNLYEVTTKLVDHLYGVEKRIKAAARKPK